MTGKIYIRTDGDQQSGLGHLVRCIALAHMLKKTFQIVFVCNKIPEATIKELQESSLVLIVIDNETSFLNQLKAGDIVVLDGYNFYINFQQKIKSIPCKLVCIDDLHDKQFAADLIINHVPGVKPTDYHAAIYTKYALGLSYALLRKPFLEQSKTVVKKNKKIETLYICFGGSDHKNLTEQTLATIKLIPDFKKIIVVTGAAYNYLATLKLKVEADARVIHYHDINDKQMISVLQQTDLAIVPASGVLFEVLTFHIPVITGSYVNNQAIFISEMTKFKQVVNSIDFSAVNLSKAIKFALTANIEYDIVFDGCSGERINALFNNL